jgi:hypothetical protein
MIAPLAMMAGAQRARWESEEIAYSVVMSLARCRERAQHRSRQRDGHAHDT